MEVDVEVEMIEMPQCDIIGLTSRIKTPLEFIGLFKCPYQASRRIHIPAKKISGEKDESQLILAGQQYLNRPAYLIEILKELREIIQHLRYKDFQPHLDLVLLAMSRYVEMKKIQLFGSVCLYYLLKADQVEDDNSLSNINLKMREKIIKILIDAMYYHKDVGSIVRNAYIILNNVFAVKDMYCEYDRLIRMLLHIVTSQKHSVSTFNFQEATMAFINRLASQVEVNRKIRIGDLGAIEHVLSLIEQKLSTKNCDEVLKLAWNFMWSVTDETPINCERFLEGRGIELFLRCKKEFQYSHTLLRNMVGMLGNVAEVKSLRPQLMNEAFITEFAMFLESDIDGIEVSCNAAELLAHITHDGPQAWTIEEPSRQDVLLRMYNAIQRWDVRTSRNIVYRSLMPILGLLQFNDTPESQLWAVWSLANLTYRDADKYCRLIDEEGGVPILKGLIDLNVHLIPTLTNEEAEKYRCSLANVQNKIMVGNQSGDLLLEELKESDIPINEPHLIRRKIVVYQMIKDLALEILSHVDIH